MQVRHESQMSLDYEVITSYGMFRTLVTNVLVSVIGVLRFYSGIEIVLDMS